jgi:hypothetical protein
MRKKILVASSFFEDAVVIHKKGKETTLEQILVVTLPRSTNRPPGIFCCKSWIDGKKNSSHTVLPGDWAV